MLKCFCIEFAGVDSKAFQSEGLIDREPGVVLVFQFDRDVGFDSVEVGPVLSKWGFKFFGYLVLQVGEVEDVVPHVMLVLGVLGEPVVRPAVEELPVEAADEAEFFDVLVLNELLLPEGPKGVYDDPRKDLDADDVDEDVVKLIEEELAPVVLLRVLWEVTVKPTANAAVVFERIVESGEEADQKRIAFILNRNYKLFLLLLYISLSWM